MQLPIEIFLDDLNLQIDSNELFAESFKCYKTGAYKAAYAFSYLGFMSVLKFRILKTKIPPNGIVQGQWSVIQTGLLDVDKWEEMLLNQTQSQKNPVFFINDDLRNQVIYWKNRRNDCVHHKNNAITRVTIEAFWDFLIHMLQRFQVNGSKESLLSSIVDHFDLNKNPTGQDVTYLVTQIPLVMEVKDYPAFFLDLKNNIKAEEFFQIFDKILLVSPNNLQSAVLDFAFQNIKLTTVANFFQRYPQYCHVLSAYPIIVRSLWKSILFTQKKNDFPLFATMLRLGLIPDEQKDEAIDTIISRLDKVFPQDEDIETFKTTNFYTKLKTKLIRKGEHMDFYNGNKIIFRHYFENVEPDVDVINLMNYVATRNFSPWGLHNQISAMFNDDKNLVTKYMGKFVDYNVTPAPFYKEIFKGE